MRHAPLYTSAALGRRLGAIEVFRAPDHLTPGQALAFQRAAAFCLAACGQMPVICPDGPVMAWPVVDGTPQASRTWTDGARLTVSRPCDCTCEGACDHPGCPRA